MDRANKSAETKEKPTVRSCTVRNGCLRDSLMEISVSEITKTNPKLRHLNLVPSSGLSGSVDRQELHLYCHFDVYLTQG